MTHRITICMGSSCFSRGNDRNLELLEGYIAEHNLDATVDLAGSRCEEKCTLGPNLSIDGQAFHHVGPDVLVDLLNRHLPVTGAAVEA